jgi:hypothetical protein
VHGTEQRGQADFGGWSHDAELRPVPFCLQDRRLPFPRQILEGGGLEQRLVELSTLKIVQNQLLKLWHEPQRSVPTARR